MADPDVRRKSEVRGHPNVRWDSDVRKALMWGQCCKGNSDENPDIGGDSDVGRALMGTLV